MGGDRVFVTRDEARRRLEICEGCEWVKGGHGAAEGLRVCLRCGCGLNGRVRCKAFLATERCPIGRWSADV